MEATKKKNKKPKTELSGEGECIGDNSIPIASGLSENMVLDRTEDVLMSDRSEPVELCRHGDPLIRRPLPTHLRNARSSNVHKKSSNTTVPVQETALTDMPLPKLVFIPRKDPKEHPLYFNPFSYMLAKHDYMPLVEPALVKLYMRDKELSDECCKSFNKNDVETTHQFYKDLVKLSHEMRKEKSNVIFVEHKKNQLDTQIDTIWDEEEKVIGESGECQDGNPVFTEFKIYEHNFNEANYQAFTQTLNDLKHKCHKDFISTAYSAELLRQKISRYIDGLCNTCLLNMAVDNPVQLLMDSEQAAFKEHVLEIRTCIGIIFKFVRHKVSLNDDFYNTLKKWLTKLVETTLKVATRQDHLYILHQVLQMNKRIPDWIKQFIQVPLIKYQPTVSPFDSLHLTHLISVLSLLMRPVKNHQPADQEKLDTSGGLDVQNDDQDASWVIVDSDGEDELGSSKQISANDIIDLFNQLPLEQMYASVLKIDKLDNRYVVDVSQYNDVYLMELLGFCTHLIRKFRLGLRTYGTVHYQQFAKRLGQLIKHTVQYVTDVYEQYCEVMGIRTIHTDDKKTPVQCEYDVFVMRSVHAIYSSQNLGVWQFLATMPFHKVSTSSLWNIYAMLHQNCEDTLFFSSPCDVMEWEVFAKWAQIYTKFENRLCVILPESESIYLLTAFSHMTLHMEERDETLTSFIRQITLDLFQVGFMFESTRDNFNKHIRTLLSSIMAQYPFLISDILKEMPRYNFVDTESSCLDLFRDLPLSNWVPNNDDLSIIKKWLLSRPLLSTEFSLARLILANLNYSAHEEEIEGEDLFLNHKFHCDVGVIVVEAALRSVTEQLPSGSSSTAALCDMVLKYVGSSTGLEVIMKWAWRVLSQLRIHCIDRGSTIPRDTIAAPEIFLQSVPDLHGQHTLQVIATAVLRSQPIASYFAVVMTTLGHSVPLICSKGFPLVNELIQKQCYSEALKCIYLLVPMFLECPDSLIQCDIFCKVILAMYAVDKSFVKLRKPFASYPDFPGYYLKHLGSLITVHLTEAGNSRYGPDSYLSMICLWLRCLAKIPDWINDISTLYLMDIVLQEAFTYQESYEAAVKLLAELYVVKIPVQTNIPDSSSAEQNKADESTSIQMFLQFKTKRMHPPIQSLMSKMYLPLTPWFAAYVLTVEQQWQRSTHIWQATLEELYDQTGRTNVDLAFKRALLNTNVPLSMPASNLPIYRWAHQALHTPLNHRILPYLWQMFFTLYLERVPHKVSGSKGGVGHKFFEGTVGVNLLKRMKKQLLDTAAHYSAMETQLRDESKDDPVLQRENREEIALLSKSAILIKTYHLWLEDMHLMDSNIILANLEPMYDIPKLRCIFEEKDLMWAEYISEKQHMDARTKSWNDWDKLNFRFKEPSRNSNVNEKRPVSPMEETRKRLSSYEATLKFEEAMTDIQPIIPVIPAEVLMYKQNLMCFVNEKLEILLNIGQLHMQTLAEHTALDCALFEFLPTLYMDIKVEKVLTAECHSSPPHRGTNIRVRPSTCAGAAEMRVVIIDSELNPCVSERIVENRSDWVDVLRRVTRPPQYETCSTIATLDLLVVNILKEYKEALLSINHQRKIVLKELVITLFFHLIDKCTEAVIFFPPTETMIHQWLKALGEVFIMNASYVEQLLMALLEKPCLVPILSGYLIPVDAGISTFMRLYGVVTRKAYESPDVETYAALLSRFSVDNLLKKFETSFPQRCTLIDAMSTAMEAAGLQPDPANENVHMIIREHFVTMLNYNFPGHFGKILSNLLQSSALQRISVDIWYDFINALFGEKKVSLGEDMPKVKEEIRIFATTQKIIPYAELAETIQVLSNYFAVERSMYGLYGLYPKYRIYVEPIMIFQAMIDHSYIVATMSQEEGALSSTICAKVWGALDNIYSPWIAPLHTEQMAEPPAAWIDQLAEDRSVLLPWIPPDFLHANKAVMMFIESTRFILDTVSGEILSYLWQFYVAKFVHRSITENVLSVIHNHMELLPWQQFRPHLVDMDLMYKVIMQSVPAEVYTFLGTIFVKVAWVPWLNNIMGIYRDNYDVQTRLYVYMLHLHVKLSKDNDVRKCSKVTEMLVCAKKFDWHFVDTVAYAQVIDWWVFKYDPKVAAGLGEPYVNPIDICVMNLLEIAGSFTTEAHHFYPTTMHKRILFLRGKVKMLIKCTHTERTFVEKNINDVSLTLQTLLTAIENIVQRTVAEEHHLEECSLLVKELLVVLNQHENSELRKVGLKVWSAWLAKENCMSIVLQGFLRVVGTDVTNSTIMGELLEICLNSYFKHTVMQVALPSWANAAQLMSAPVVPCIEDTLLTGGHFLTLHAILYQGISSTKSIREEVTLLSKLVEWICQLKAVTIEESKLPLLWGIALLLIDRHCQLSESLLSITRSVRRLISHYLELAEEKGQLWNLLGTLGIRKQVNLSPKGRFLCRAMAVFLLAQLPERDGEELTLRMGPNAPGAIANSQENMEVIDGPTPTADALRCLHELEGLTSSKAFAELKDTVNLALKLIKDPAQSILTARQFLGTLTAELYKEQYLHVLSM